MSIPIEQTKAGFWEQLIQEAIHEPNPVLCNLKITRCHYLLSQALQQVIGEDAGANFHSWAVWGSRKAGATIRMEDMEEARRDGRLVGGIVGAVVGIVAGWFLRSYFPAWTPLPLLLLAALLFGAACGAFAGWQIVTSSRTVSAGLILAGNRTVLEDIGTQSARFIEAFHDQTEADPKRLTAFLDGMRPGDTASGGQDLLRRAFANYHLARFASDTKTKQEAAYLANCQAVFHEHVRLEPYILGAMPVIIRRCVTRRTLQYDIGPVRLAVAHDVPTLEGIPFPPSLETLENTELRNFLSGPCGTDSDASSAGSGARDWTKFGERMRYIVHLFRALHIDPVVENPPYDPARLSAIAANTVPAGPL